MRRTLATLAAAALLLSSVGSAVGAEPDASTSPAPIVEPPAPDADPVPPTSEPAPESSAAPDAATPAPIVAAPVDPAAPAPATVAPDSAPGKGARPASPTDPTNRWIVVLDPGVDAGLAATRHGKRLGFASERTFKHAFRGYSAILDRGQVTALRHDPSVAMIVADEKIQIAAQTIPTGISRSGATRSTVARINGLDERVDADVAVVDTGIAVVSDLNVAGGYNCSTTNRALWRDVQGHGTHVAGTVGAIDNGNGVVGVAPGVRLWAVKILDDTGEGLLSWYVCGLDWIAAQRDPSDPTRPLFESVNMSVAKYGKDDANCGFTNNDLLHQAICRLVSGGVTVVAAAANDSSSAAARVPAAYNEVITVSALADSDGKAGGLGGNRCYSWGTYDVDDTFADFSNYGSDVDLIAPGKCIWSTVPGGYKYSSGTSMAAPHVAGAAALLKASRPGLTPAEVREALQYLGTLNWQTSTDPDPYHEKLLDVSRLGPRGTFGVATGSDVVLGEAGGIARFPITITRSTTSFERVRLSASGLPSGATASFDLTSVYGFGTAASTLAVTVPTGLAPGAYAVTVSGNEHGSIQQATATIRIEGDPPVALPPAVGAQSRGILGSSTVPSRVFWPAASDPTTAIAGYELEESVNGGPWTPTAATAASVRSALDTQALGSSYRYRVRARDAVGNWSGWADGPSVSNALVQDRNSALTYTGTWTKQLYTAASGGSTTYAKAAGARVRTTFSGRGIALVAPQGPTRGSAAIYVDGVYRGTVSFRASSGRSRVVMYTTTFATLGTHSIEVRLVGNGRVDVDAFVVLR
ncbi:MAG TPA: S8 family serine peptidase [Candidatus Limnocylindrales bacterium]|nr:S8 family serine peptidase [Candidatus Limnocylindrales bacterium]